MSSVYMTGGKEGSFVTGFRASLFQTPLPSNNRCDTTRKSEEKRGIFSLSIRYFFILIERKTKAVTVILCWQVQQREQP